MRDDVEALGLAFEVWRMCCQRTTGGSVCQPASPRAVKVCTGRMESAAELPDAIRRDQEADEERNSHCNRHSGVVGKSSQHAFLPVHDWLKQADTQSQTSPKAADHCRHFCGQ